MLTVPKDGHHSILQKEYNEDNVSLRVGNMVNQVSTPAPVCPVCKHHLINMGESSILKGLPRSVDKLDYYVCNSCRGKNMNRYCFAFYHGITYVFSNHKNWKELNIVLNPSRRTNL